MPYPTTTAALEASIVALPTAFRGLCTRTAFNVQTSPVGGPRRSYSFLKIGKGSGANRPAALIVAGMHAREWAQPDAVITFVGQLLTAYSGNTPFTIPIFTDTSGTVHGPVVLSAATVQAIVDNMDTYVVPNANPEGREFSMSAAANNLWRKNRGGTPTPAIGTDLNRNFDIAWDFDVYYSAAAAAHPSFSTYTSKNTSKDVYIGSGPFSEPETQNIKFLLDTFPIGFYIDLHSFSEKVMFPWGIETNGTTPAQHFRNAALDHTRDGITGTAYQEFFPNTPPLRLLDKHVTMANSIRDKIRDATGAVYTAAPSVGLYPCTGTSDDYAFSRQFVPATPRTIYAFSMEFGTDVDFFAPSTLRYPKIEREIHAALVAFLSQIAVWSGLVPVAVTPPPSSGSTSTCFIATAAFGSVDHPDVVFLNSIHEALSQHWLTATPVRIAEKIYGCVGPQAARYLDNHELPRRLLRRGIFAPMVAALRRLVPESDRDAH